jgi:bacterioferritin-associated ferredoxin
MSQIYDDLGGSPECGRCAHSIKRIMEKLSRARIGIRDHDDENS